MQNEYLKINDLFGDISTCPQMGAREMRVETRKETRFNEPKITPF